MRYLLGGILGVLLMTAGVAIAGDEGWLVNQLEEYFGSGGKVLGDITLVNDEKISNSTDGLVCLVGSGGTSDEDICIDLDGADIVDVTSRTGAATVDVGSIGLACGSLDVSEGDITNVGDLQCDSITADGTGITIGGTGAASTESLLWQFGEIGDRVDVSSPTGATLLDYALDLALDDLSMSGHLTLEQGGEIRTTGNGELVLIGGSTDAGYSAIRFGVGGPKIGGTANQVVIKNAADTGYGAFYAGQMQALSAPVIAGTHITAGSYVQAAAASYFEHATRTKWTSSGNGIWEMGINDGTQGIRWDLATAANVAAAYDESGNGIRIQAENLAAVTAKGALSQYTTKVESVTFAGNPGDASKVTTGTAIPDGADLAYVTTRVVTLGTNCAGYSIGDGADVDLWGADIAVADTTTSTAADHTATWSHPALANQEITITGTNGAGVPANCFDLVVAITAHFTQGTAATSD